MHAVFVERTGALDIRESPLPRMLSVQLNEELAGVADDGPTFVFVMGLEGTGHHFINSLLGRSPNMRAMKKIGVCSSVGELFKLSAQFFSMGKVSRLFNPARRQREGLDADQHYENVVDILATIRQKFNEQQQEEQTSTGSSLPFHIAINANSCGRPSMMSYPNYPGPDRALQNFNLDIFYNACADAKVKCKHVFIYRDPYDVIKSNTINRLHNPSVYDSIRIYTSVLQLIHSQMISHLDKNLGCFGFLDATGYQLQQDWERFGLLFGWDSFGSLKAHVDNVLAKVPTPMSEDARAELIPSRLSVLMKALEDISNRVNGLCYSSLNPNEGHALSTTKSAEGAIVEE